MYKRPSIYTYREEELADMLGPVETQYTPVPPPVTCDDCEVLGGGDTVELSAVISYDECVDFTQVSIRVIGPTPGTYNLPRSGGETDTGAPAYQWSTFLPPRGSGSGSGGGNGNFAPGIYTLECTLTAPDGNTTCTSVGFNVFPPGTGN